MKLKYIVTDMDCFAIFSDTAVHRDISRGLYGVVIGAGFCKFEDGKIHCWGESITLRIKSRKEDEKIINDKINKESCS